MKIRFVLFFIVTSLLASTICKAQITFKKNYNAAGNQKLELFQLGDQNYFGAFGYGSGIAKLDSLGNFLYQHTYANDTFLPLRRLAKHSDNLYYFTSNYYRDSCSGYPNIYPVVGKMDSLGNILSAHYYHINPDCRNFTGAFGITNDEGVVLCGEYANFFILKVDSNENYLWSKHFSSYHSGGTQFVEALPDNNILVGFNLDTAGATVAKLDSAGNFIWCKSYFRPRGYIHDCVIDFDGSYLITGYTDSISPPSQFPPYPPGFAPKYFMMKLDTSGNVLWCKGYGTNNHWLMKQESKIINTLDGNHLIYATVITPYSFVPMLIKTDLNGDTLWTIVHYAFQHWYETASIISTSEGGFLFNGIMHAFSGGGDIFLYKTDSMGRSYCNELQEPIYVYNLFPTDSNIVLNSVSGGYGLPANVNDGTHPFPTVTTECITGGVTSAAPWKRSFSLFPNPTSGQVHIYRKDPYISNCFYSVYNSQGRLLIQQKFIDGNEDTPVDLSKYSKGVYLIKITDGVEVVTKKVVFE